MAVSIGSAIAYVGEAIGGASAAGAAGSAAAATATASELAGAGIVGAGTAAAGATGGSLLGTVGTAAATAAATAGVGRLLQPKAPKIPGVTPMPDEQAQMEARKRSIAESMARRGRASTIMTDAPAAGTLGG